jgi:hypothetical protein
LFSALWGFSMSKLWYFLFNFCSDLIAYRSYIQTFIFFLQTYFNFLQLVFPFSLHLICRGTSISQFWGLLPVFLSVFAAAFVFDYLLFSNCLLHRCVLCISATDKWRSVPRIDHTFSPQYPPHFSHFSNSQLQPCYTASFFRSAAWCVHSSIPRTIYVPCINTANVSPPTLISANRFCLWVLLNLVPIIWHIVHITVSLAFCRT